MGDIVSNDQMEAAKKLRRFISKYFENKDLVLMGGYAQGQDPDLDKALSLWSDITKFLHQDEKETCEFNESVKKLIDLTSIA